jgi:hypothetical protein
MADEVKAQAVITREFVDGKMIVKRDGVEVRQVTVEQLESRIANIGGRITMMTERKATVEDWKAQAEASA